jgi:hypothetical protein
MAARIARLLPWLIAEAALVLLEAILWPEGGVWMLMIWNAILAMVRAAVAQTAARRNKLTVDVAFAILCFMAAWEGGWYLLPAAVAFGVVDAVVKPAPPIDPRELPGEQVAAAASAILGWLAIGVFISGPLYSSASTTLLPDGSTATSHSPASPLVVGPSTQSIVVLGVAVLLFAATWLFASLDGRRHSPLAYTGLATTTMALTALAILGAMSVGLFLAPGVALALVALWLAHSARQSSTATTWQRR